jgi:hypothetical protein
MEIQEQIQEPELVAEMENGEIVAGAITDGSQAIAHDGFDVETFEQASDDYARLARTVTETEGAIRTGPALLRDLFWSFHKRAPRIEPIAPLSPAHEINREIVEQILSTTEWREMRESGTVGDPLSSAMATIGCAASAVAALDKETIRPTRSPRSPRAVRSIVCCRARSRYWPITTLKTSSISDSPSAA